MSEYLFYRMHSSNSSVLSMLPEILAFEFAIHHHLFSCRRSSAVYFRSYVHSFVSVSNTKYHKLIINKGNKRRYKVSVTVFTLKFPLTFLQINLSGIIVGVNFFR